MKRDDAGGVVTVLAVVLVAFVVAAAGRALITPSLSVSPTYVRFRAYSVTEIALAAGAVGYVLHAVAGAKLLLRLSAFAALTGLIAEVGEWLLEHSVQRSFNGIVTTTGNSNVSLNHVTELVTLSAVIVFWLVSEFRLGKGSPTNLA